MQTLSLQPGPAVNLQPGPSTTHVAMAPGAAGVAGLLGFPTKAFAWKGALSWLQSRIERHFARSRNTST